MRNVYQNLIHRVKFERNSIQSSRLYRRLAAFSVVVAMVGAFSSSAAVTNKNQLCGFDEHSHGDGCYVHLICELETPPEHVHDEACAFSEESELVCVHEEPEESVFEGHTHVDDCFEIQQGELTCVIEETEPYSHTEECYDEDSMLICGNIETEGHSHDEACFETVTVTICGETEAGSETESETEPAGEPAEEPVEHVHGDECYSITRTYECEPEIPEDAHFHTADCYVPASADDEGAILICALIEHKHTADCYNLTNADGTEVAEEAEDEDTSEDTDAAEEVETVDIPNIECVLFATIFEDGDYINEVEADVIISVSGMLPDGGCVYAYPVEVNVDLDEGEEVVLAYDISIFDANGNKWQPDESVIVTFEAAVLESADVVNVYHINDAEITEEPAPADEAPADEAPVNADENNEAVESEAAEEMPIGAAAVNTAVITDAIVETEAADDAVEPEFIATAPVEGITVQFAADSFSVYYVTVTLNGTRLTLSYHTTTDDDGNPTDKKTINISASGTGTIEIQPGDELILSAVLANSNQYNWFNITTTNGAKITKVSDHNNGGANSHLFFKSFRISDISDGDTLTIAYYASGNKTCYLKINVVAPEYRIVDTIAVNGLLTAVTTNERVASYKWFRGNSVTPIPQEANGVVFLEGNKLQSINVAKHQGSLATYTVKFYDEDEIEIVGSSVTYKVPYADKIRNGGFEDVENIANNRDQLVGSNPKRTNQYLQDYWPQLIWRTTGVCGSIEIVNTTDKSNPSQAPYGASAAASGDQFAELNSESFGTLYQDVLTAPGTDLYWSLSHRARIMSTSGNSVTNNMYVVILKSSEAEKIITQSDAQDVARAIVKKDTTFTTAAGLSVDLVGAYAYYCSTTSNKNTPDKWATYGAGEIYKVPDEQYLTRFFFVSMDGSGSSEQAPTHGNFIDEVSFSQTIPYTIEHYLLNADGTINKKLPIVDSGEVGPYTLVNAATQDGYITYTGSNHNYIVVNTKKLGNSVDYEDYNYLAWSVHSGKTVLKIYYIEPVTRIEVKKVFEGITSAAFPTEAEGGYTITFTLYEGTATTGTPKETKSMTFYKGADLESVIPTIFYNNLKANTTYTIVEEAGSIGDDDYLLGATTSKSGSTTGNRTITVKTGENQSVTCIEYTNPYTREGANVSILKVDGKDVSKKLAGATFALYTEKEEPVGDPVTTNTDGRANFNKIVPGNYKLVETTAPIDYDLLEYYICFNVAENTGAITLMNDGWLKPLTNDEINELDYTLETVEGETGVYRFVIKNYIYTIDAELPETGGIGTIPFTLAGVSLCGLSGGLLLRRKRKEVVFHK